MNQVQKVNKDRPAFVTTISMFPNRPAGGNVITVGGWHRNRQDLLVSTYRRHHNVTAESFRRMCLVINERTRAGIAHPLLSELGSTTFID